MFYSSKNSKIHIGFTSDLESRLKSHNELAKKGWKLNIGRGKLCIQKFLSKREKHKKGKRIKRCEG